MSDNDKATGRFGPAGLQVVGEPRNALQIEVVGGLVKDEDVPLVNKEGRQRNPACLATAEAPDRRAPVKVRDQPIYDLTNCGIARPHVFGGVADNGLPNLERRGKLITL